MGGWLTVLNLAIFFKCIKKLFSVINNCRLVSARDLYITNFVFEAEWICYAFSCVLSFLIGRMGGWSNPIQNLGILQTFVTAPKQLVRLHKMLC